MLKPCFNHFMHSGVFDYFVYRFTNRFFANNF